MWSGEQQIKWYCRCNGGWYQIQLAGTGTQSTGRLLARGGPSSQAGVGGSQTQGEPRSFPPDIAPRTGAQKFWEPP